ncbi:MAG: methylated-DNA--[protein]-cysteine S-methyltransferase [Nannocystaceae bacterium]
MDHPHVPLTVAVDPEGALLAVSFGDAASLRERARARGATLVDAGAEPVAAPARAGLERAATQLREYLAGERRDFDLTLRPSPSGTDFQRRAWGALRAIPYGETRSYAEQAAAIGAPTASRAIGAANGANPLPIVVPCHRVLGADGSLTGFAGGVAIKRWLLDHEGARPQRSLFAAEAGG